MRNLSLDLDLATGAVVAVGTDGRRYRLEEVEAADRAARRGDAAAAATLRAVDHGVDADGAALAPHGIRQRFEQIIHDCPDCQAALARGEVPITWTASDGTPPPFSAPGWTAPVGPRPSNSHARRRARLRGRR